MKYEMMKKREEGERHLDETERISLGDLRMQIFKSRKKSL